MVAWGNHYLATYCAKSQEQLIFDSDRFKQPLAPVAVKVNQQELIFVLRSDSSILIINKDLQNKYEQGVIHTQEVSSKTCIDFFPLDKIKLRRELPVATSLVKEF